MNVKATQCTATGGSNAEYSACPAAPPLRDVHCNGTGRKPCQTPIFSKFLTETPAIGTACNPVRHLLAERFGGDYTQTFVEDAFVLFQAQDGVPEDLEVVFIAHQDEVGGCVYGPHQGGFLARVWGNDAAIFNDAPLQAFDWLADSGAEAFPIATELVTVHGEERLLVKGDGIRPYRTGFTFIQETTFDGDTITGKALDPRVTLYAAVEAVRQFHDKRVGGAVRHGGRVRDGCGA